MPFPIPIVSAILSEIEIIDRNTLSLLFVVCVSVLSGGAANGDHLALAGEVAGM